MNLAGTLAPGSVFARDFRIIRPLAEGGMGAVYVVEQVSTGKRRALKILRPQLLTDARMRTRFVREATVASTIESDHVVEVVAAGVDEQTEMPWIAMELLNGLNLGAVVARRQRLSVAEVSEVFRPLCHALSAAHRQGIVHRDLKPENVFLARARRADAQFTIKLLDFGIATVVEEATRPAGRPGEESATARSPTTAAIGSPLWMSPEQITLRAVSPATDVWALGLLAFWALVGAPYWKAAHASSILLEAIIAEKLFSNLEPASVRVASLGVDVTLPASFDEWFAKCVAREPMDRFPDAGTAMAALDSMFATSTSGDAARVDLGALLDEVAAPPVATEPSGNQSVALPLLPRPPGKRALSRGIIGMGALTTGLLAGGLIAVVAVRKGNFARPMNGPPHAHAELPLMPRPSLASPSPPRPTASSPGTQVPAPLVPSAVSETHVGGHPALAHPHPRNDLRTDGVAADLRRDVTSAMRQSLGRLEDQTDSLHRQLASATSPDEIGSIQRSAAATEARADDVVASYDRQASASSDPAFAAMFRDLARQARAYLQARREARGSVSPPRTP